jgi:hypothetical protein
VRPPNRADVQRLVTRIQDENLSQLADNVANRLARSGERAR